MSTTTAPRETGLDLGDHAEDWVWWKDPEILIPVFSGLAFLTGLACAWFGAELAATVLFWVGLLLGASMFVPGALRDLFTQGSAARSGDSGRPTHRGAR